MIINQSTVTAQATRSYQKATYQQRMLQFGSESDFQTNESNPNEDTDEKLDIQQNNRKRQDIAEIQAPSVAFARTPSEVKEQVLERMLSVLTGKRFSLSKTLYQQTLESSQTTSSSFFFGRVNQGKENGFHVFEESASFESESVMYQASGMVQTADGKSIAFDVSMAMSRSTATYAQKHLGFIPQTKPIDPLVINYAGTAASLTETKYAFDLDADGVMDNISFTGSGSGFLALDKNGDGIINDGNELFGPQTGNGFEELRKYDTDGNGWIDEADDVYSQLRVWSKDEDGNDVMYTLKELDIGAIYLGETSTEFGMYDANGNAQGQMRSTSVFLKDSGGAGMIHHIDLYA